MSLKRVVREMRKSAFKKGLDKLTPMEINEEIRLTRVERSNGRIYENLQRLKGQVKFSLDLKSLRKDR